jgi:hypothetical protein
MDRRIISRITEILETDPDFFVPIKKLWLLLQDEGLSLDLEEFQRMLQKDARFEFAPGVDHKKGSETSPYSGTRIKLVSREMTAKDIFEGMTRSLTRINQALQNAWETRPTDDQETEDQLLEILAAGQHLEREIQELIEHQGQTENM